MIAVLLLAAGLVLGGIGFGVYLLVRPDPPAGTATAPPVTPPPATSSPGSPSGTVTSPPPGTTTPGGPGPGGGSGSGSTSVERPGGSTEADLRAVARDYVDAVNARDETAASGLTCARADPGTLFSVAEGREVTLGEVEVLAGTVASATVLVEDEETALLMENQEDGWCVAI